MECFRSARWRVIARLTSTFWPPLSFLTHSARSSKSQEYNRKSKSRFNISLTWKLHCRYVQAQFMESCWLAVVFRQDGDKEYLKLKKIDRMVINKKCLWKSTRTNMVYFLCIDTLFLKVRECIEFIYCQYTLAVGRVTSNTLPLWKKEWQYIASSQDE